MVVKVIIKVGLSGGTETTIGLCDTEEQFQSITVRQLKEKISQAENLPGLSVPLVFKDTYLDRDDALLSEYGIQHMSVIYICLPEPQGPGGGMGDKEGKNRSMEMLFLF